jgi:Glycosyl transferase family 2
MSGDRGRRRSGARRAERAAPSPGESLRRLDTLRLPKGHHELRAFLTVRNESTRLPFTLNHHRAVGIDRFFVADNGSTDGTVEMLLGEPDVHVFSAKSSYAAAQLGMSWMHTLLNAHGAGRWVAVIDADEHLVFPGCESMDLRDYCRGVEQTGADAISAMALDMYSSGPIAKAAPGRQTSLLKVCPYFDATGYVVTGTCYDMPAIHGGPRMRIFWPEVDLRGAIGPLEGLVERAWDDEHYLARHADVRTAVKEGVVRSGLEHFLRYGRAEGRPIGIRPVRGWPEQAYLKANPEVAAAISEGIIESGLEHYLRFGQFEGRFLGFDPSPCLTVAPLVRWSGSKKFVTGRHHLRGAAFTTAHEFGAALLHFKMLDDFAVRAHQEARRGEHWQEAVEYRRYDERLTANPMLSPRFDGSVRYAGSQQLVDLGYMRDARNAPGVADAGNPRPLRPLGRLR